MEVEAASLIKRVRDSVSVVDLLYCTCQTLLLYTFPRVVSLFVAAVSVITDRAVLTVDSTLTITSQLPTLIVVVYSAVLIALASIHPQLVLLSATVPSIYSCLSRMRL